jgi:hypothetical protein
VFLPVSHHVDAPNSGDLSNFLNDLETYPPTFLSLSILRNTLQPSDNGLGNDYSRYFGSYPFSGLGRSQRPNSDEDKHAIVKSPISYIPHELLQAEHVKAKLGLDEIGAGVDFLSQPQRPKVVRGSKGILCRSEKQMRWAFQLAATQKLAPVSQNTRCAQQTDGIQIKHWLRFRLVSCLDAISGQTQDVSHAQRRRTQQVTLNGNPVPVSAGNLQDRLIARASQQGTDGHAGHVHMCAGSIRCVDGIAN